MFKFSARTLTLLSGIVLTLVVGSQPLWADATLDGILAGAHRSDGNRARDVYRHPVQTLEFFGVKPDMTVVEIWPGGGWYTEILGPYLRDKGVLYAAHYPEGKLDKYYVKSLAEYKAKLAGDPAIYDRVKLTELMPPDHLTIAPAGSADAVLTFRNVHNWLDGKGSEVTVMKAAFAALKPGGVFGVVDHRAAPGTTAEVMEKSGYITEDTVIKAAEAAGFVLEARSEINANPKDTKDYAEGVWTLPPTLALGEKDKAKYLAIGESDRMTFRFRKPAK